MHAVTLSPGKAGSQRLDDIAEPVAAQGSILVRALAVGVCGTDRDIIDVVALPVLAAVPYVVTESDVRRARRHRLLTMVAVTVLIAVAGSGAWALRLWKFLI